MLGRTRYTPRVRSFSRWCGKQFLAKSARKAREKAWENWKFKSVTQNMSEHTQAAGLALQLIRGTSWFPTRWVFWAFCVSWAFWVSWASWVSWAFFTRHFESFWGVFSRWQFLGNLPLIFIQPVVIPRANPSFWGIFGKMHPRVEIEFNPCNPWALQRLTRQFESFWDVFGKMHPRVEILSNPCNPCHSKG